MPTTDYVRYMLALVLVLGLILALGQLAKKYNWATLGIKLATRSNKRLQIVEMQAIDTRHRLLLARRDTVEYVLAVSPDGITLLDKIPAQPSSFDDPSEAHPT